MIRHILLAGAVLACMSGAAKAQANPYVGEIRTFAVTFCPTGWLPTKGQLVSTTTYSVLFDLIGTRYGGNGTSWFALPRTRPVTAVNAIALTQCIAYEGVLPLQN
jgi:hypothetical protein